MPEHEIQERPDRGSADGCHGGLDPESEPPVVPQVRHPVEQRRQKTLRTEGSITNCSFCHIRIVLLDDLAKRQPDIAVLPDLRGHDKEQLGQGPIELPGKVNDLALAAAQEVAQMRVTQVTQVPVW